MSLNADPLPFDESSSFTGGEASALDAATAAEWTNRYRQKQPDQLQGHFFGRKVIERILAQPGCMGLRIYYALDPNNEQHLLIVGADASQNDQLPGQVPLSDAARQSPLDFPKSPEPFDPEFIIAEMSTPCPPHSGNRNRLNSSK